MVQVLRDLRRTGIEEEPVGPLVQGGKLRRSTNLSEHSVSTLHRLLFVHWSLVAIDGETMLDENGIDELLDSFNKILIHRLLSLCYAAHPSDT
jgi:hypothetical protein